MSITIPGPNTRRIVNYDRLKKFFFTETNCVNVISIVKIPLTDKPILPTNYGYSIEFQITVVIKSEEEKNGRPKY